MNDSCAFFQVALGVRPGAADSLPAYESPLHTNQRICMVSRSSLPTRPNDPPRLRAFPTCRPKAPTESLGASYGPPFRPFPFSPLLEISLPSLR